MLCQSIAWFVLQERAIGECYFILHTPNNIQGVKQKQIIKNQQRIIKNITMKKQI